MNVILLLLSITGWYYKSIITYLGLAEEHDLEVETVTQSELLAGDYHFAVLGGPDKGRTCARAHYDYGVHDVINETLVVIVVHVYIAVFAAINSKLLSI